MTMMMMMTPDDEPPTLGVVMVIRRTGSLSLLLLLLLVLLRKLVHQQSQIVRGKPYWICLLGSGKSPDFQKVGISGKSTDPVSAQAGTACVSLDHALRLLQL